MSLLASWSVGVLCGPASIAATTAGETIGCMGTLNPAADLRQHRPVVLGDRHGEFRAFEPFVGGGVVGPRQEDGTDRCQQRRSVTGIADAQRRQRLGSPAGEEDDVPSGDGRAPRPRHRARRPAVRPARSRRRWRDVVPVRRTRWRPAPARGRTCGGAGDGPRTRNRTAPPAWRGPTPGSSPGCRASSLIVKPREGCAVRNARMLAARVAAGAGRAMAKRYSENMEGTGLDRSHFAITMPHRCRTWLERLTREGALYPKRRQTRTPGPDSSLDPCPSDPSAGDHHHRRTGLETSGSGLNQTGDRQ